MTQPQTDTRALRNALGRFATGVAIVTAIDPDGQPVGLTVNSFSAVSLDPALVLWCLDNNSHNLAAFRKASHHAINILAANQQELSNRFATWPADRFAGLTVVNQVAVTGRAYSWMTGMDYYNPGGNFVRIPDDHQGLLGGNRFFTLRKDPK